jgi:hypothetical protein
VGVHRYPHGSTSYHIQIHGHTERLNQVFEYIIHIHVMDKPFMCESYLHLVNFSYNNGHQEYLEMSPFESLHVIICNTLTSFDNPVNKIVFGLDILMEMEQEDARIRKNLKVAHDRHKIYENKNRVNI